MGKLIGDIFQAFKIAVRNIYWVRATISLVGLIFSLNLINPFSVILIPWFAFLFIFYAIKFFKSVN